MLRDTMGINVGKTPSDRGSSVASQRFTKTLNGQPIETVSNWESMSMSKFSSVS